MLNSSAGVSADGDPLPTITAVHKSKSVNVLGAESENGAWPASNPFTTLGGGSGIVERVRLGQAKEDVVFHPFLNASLPT